MSLRLGRILGFPVEIDWSWFVIFVLVAWAIKDGLLVRFAPGYYPPGLLIAAGIVGGLLFFASLVGHELAHCYIARQKGVPIAGITLFVFGGVARMKSEPDFPGDELRMALAGPIFSIVTSAFLYLVWGAQILPQIWGELVRYLAIANLAVAVFNLIPAFPSDGGRALRAIVWSWTGNLQTATRVAAGLGQAFGWVLVFVGIFRLLMLDWGGIWFILIGLFLQNAAQAALQQVQWRRAMRGLSVRDLMRPSPIVLPPDISLETAVHDYFLREPTEILPVVGEGRVMGTVSVQSLRSVPYAQWTSTPVTAVMSEVAADSFVDPDEDAWTALSNAAGKGDAPLLVVDSEGTLVGTVSEEALARQIQLRMHISA